MTRQLIASFIVSFAATVAIGYFLVPWLRRIKAGQSIREDGPVWHMSKSGTPTMGGLMFILGMGIACVTAGFTLMRERDYGHIYLFLFSVCYGAVGFIDDYEKLRKKQNLGLTASSKFLLQLTVALAFVILLRLNGYLTANLFIPFVNVTIPLPEPLYLGFASFVIVGTVNAVNLTDGLDGLASGTTIPVAVFYTLICCYWGREYLSLGVFAASLTGGLCGFLIYNFNPAKIIMGDTGSLFLGGAVCALAFALDMPVILAPLGIIYVIEVLSDILQVTVFKLTKDEKGEGKRLFKMAPFHHHLEMGGWSGRKWTEKEVFVLFTGVSAIMAIVCFMAVRGRYGL